MENYKIPNREIQQYSRNCVAVQFFNGIGEFRIYTISEGQNSDKEVIKNLNNFGQVKN